MITSHPSLTALVSLCAPLAFGAIGCGSSDPTGLGGNGKVSITTWGEQYIEDEIPTDSGDGDGFVDGWSLSYEKFLVVFQNVVIANAAGETAARMEGSKLFDNAFEGVKPLVEFDDIPAKAWDQFSYEIAGASAATERAVNVPEADKTLMMDGGYSLYVAGTASKDAAEKHFAWGFPIGTRYQRCHSVADGKDSLGIVVTNNSTVDVQLTTHGDHFFYDRLQTSPDPAVPTSLRFDAIAAADANEDGEVTLDELKAVPLDVRLYNRSSLPAATLGAFVTSLARTVGHFRGEGECEVEAL